MTSAIKMILLDTDRGHPRHSKPSRNSIVDLNEQQPVCVHDDVVSDTIAVHYNIIEYVGQDLMWLRHR